MNTSNIRLGTILGIPIFLHSTTLWFLAGIALFVRLEMALATAIVLCIVLLHELGHSLAARRYGIDVLKISIYPFGGMAHMAMIPERPKEELVVAIAGPATNFALAVPGILILALTGGFGGASLAESPLLALTWLWTWINIVLGAFNLLPAFPMDGGRVLRALLVPKVGYLAATEVAARVGRWVAGAMILWALFGPGFGVGLFFVAIFIWVMGGRELFAVRMRHAAAAGGANGVNEIFARMFSSQGGPFQSSGSPFGGPSGPPPPSDPTPRAPGEIEIIVEPKAAKKGFDESAVRRLESFHGKLPKHPL